MDVSEIYAAIPHRPPFLLVDEIVARDASRIVCRKRFTGDEWFFAGHYPDHPLVPGVLLCEAALQAGAILLALSPALAANNGMSDKNMPVVTRMSDVRFKQIVRPGDVIEIDVQLRERLSEAFYFDAKVTCGGKLAARLEFACMIVPRAEVAL